jgi:hypothetical protein
MIYDFGLKWKEDCVIDASEQGNSEPVDKGVDRNDYRLFVNSWENCDASLMCYSY